MADLIKWSGGGGIAFFSKSTEMRGVKDISISASAETEEQTADGEKYTSKKNDGSYQITLTAVLNAALGVDVQTLALKMADCARTGSTGYFYSGDKKLFPSNFMCVSAEISNIAMTSSGKWTYCEVKWTLKQCSKYDGGTGSTPSTTTPAAEAPQEKQSVQTVDYTTPAAKPQNTPTSTAAKDIAMVTLGDETGVTIGSTPTTTTTQSGTNVKDLIKSGAVSVTTTAKEASQAAYTSLTTPETTTTSGGTTSAKSSTGGSTAKTSTATKKVVSAVSLN